jgi:uncharacterized surface protein with fasciclin (FAS1) repeats
MNCSGVLLSDGNYSNFADAIANAGIEAWLENDNITVFAPKNDNFTSTGQSADELSYYLIPAIVYSTDLTGLDFPLTYADQAMKIINGQIEYALMTYSTITAVDTMCSNGVIHTIDTPLMAPGLPSEVAVASGALNGLVAALVNTSLVATVDGLEDTTIFAPMDPALDAWDTLPSDVLAETLTYHVVSGAIAYSNTLSDGMTVTTVQGDDLTITIGTDGSVMVNDATVLIADVMTSMGVVHVIDSVISLPTTTTPPTTNATNSTSPAFVAGCSMLVASMSALLA